MEPYNVKVITYPNLKKQYRIYHNDVYYKGRSRKDRVKNPFDGQWTRDIEIDIDKHFEHVLEVSMKRTRGKVFDYARCNEWEWFVTFTLNREKVDRFNYDECVKVVSKWLNNLRRTNVGLFYLVVPEMHKSGAWHFHGLFGGLSESEIVWSGRYVRKHYRKYGRVYYINTKDKIYRFGHYKLGFMSATKIKDRERVTSYITKYITKDLCNVTYKRKRYWSSRNLLLPIEENYYLDATDRFILSTELDEIAEYKKSSVVQYGEMTQGLKLFEL